MDLENDEYIASYFNTKVLYLSIFPTRFISLISIISLWRVKVQTKGNVGRIHSGILPQVYIVRDVLCFDWWIVPESGMLEGKEMLEEFILAYNPRYTL